MTIGKSSIGSLGSSNFHSRAGHDQSESYDNNKHFTLISNRPSLVVETNPQDPIVIELGAGVIGFSDISKSYLHRMTTPNPKIY